MPSWATARARSPRPRSAGILSLADAAKVVARRSQALRELSGRGGMASIAQDAEAVRERISRWDGRLSIAAVNGPGRHRGLRRSSRPQRTGRGVPGRRDPDPDPAGGLRLPQRTDRTAPGADPDVPGRHHPRPGPAPDDLGDDGPVAGRPRDRPAVLVRQPARPGGVRPRGPGPGGIRARGVRRGLPAPGADSRDHRPGGHRHAAPGRRRPGPVPGRAGRRARPRRPRGLGRGAYRRAAGRPAHLRLPAPPVLAASVPDPGGGRGRLGRRGTVLGRGRPRRRARPSGSTRAGRTSRARPHPPRPRLLAAAGT